MQCFDFHSFDIKFKKYFLMQVYFQISNYSVEGANFAKGIRGIIVPVDMRGSCINLSYFEPDLFIYIPQTKLKSLYLS